MTTMIASTSTGLTQPGVRSARVGAASASASAGPGRYQTSSSEAPASPMARAALPSSAMRPFSNDVDDATRVSSPPPEVPRCDGVPELAVAEAALPPLGGGRVVDGQQPLAVGEGAGPLGEGQFARDVVDRTRGDTARAHAGGERLECGESGFDHDEPTREHREQREPIVVEQRELVEHDDRGAGLGAVERRVERPGVGDGDAVIAEHLHERLGPCGRRVVGTEPRAAGADRALHHEEHDRAEHEQYGEAEPDAAAANGCPQGGGETERGVGGASSGRAHRGEG